MHGEQDGIRITRGFTRAARPGVALCLTRELLELLPAARVAEDNVVAGTREERPELASHQP